MSMKTSQKVASILLFSSCTMVVFGAAPVARVISTESVDVDGIAAPARNFTPVAVGDYVTTQNGAAVLQFRDGSSVSIQPNSQIRVEGQPSGPKVRVVSGTVGYALSPASRLRVLNSKGETISRVLDSALPDATAAVQRNLAVEAAVVYRKSGLQTGGMAPNAAIAVGQFTGSVFYSSGTVTTIKTPSGLTINLTATTVGGVTTYTVASITQTVTTTGGATQTLTVSDPSLIGATVGGITSGTTSGSSVTVTFTAPGSTTPIPTTTVLTNLNTGITTAVTTQAPGATVPTPVQTTSFSASAP